MKIFLVYANDQQPYTIHPLFPTRIKTKRMILQQIHSWRSN